MHELSPQGSRAWLNRTRTKCVAKMGINNELDSIILYIQWSLFYPY